MRKAIIYVIAILTIVLFLAACGGGKPDDVSEEMYQNAIYVIKVVDLYLEGEATAEETYDKLDSMNLPDYGTQLDKEEYADASINTAIFGIKTRVNSVKLGIASLSELRESRDKLAEAINYKD